MNLDNGQALSCPDQAEWASPLSSSQPIALSIAGAGVSASSDTKPWPRRHSSGSKTWGSASASSRWRYRATLATAPHRARSGTLRGRRRSGRGPPARSAPITRMQHSAASELTVAPERAAGIGPSFVRCVHAMSAWAQGLLHDRGGTPSVRRTSSAEGARLVQPRRPVGRPRHAYASGTMPPGSGPAGPVKGLRLGFVS